MSLSLVRKAAFALVAVSGLASAPSFAGSYGGDAEVFYHDDGFGVVREMPVRPIPPRRLSPQWEQADEFLSPRRIVRMLRQQGYAQVAEIDLRGDYYRVIAVRRNGALVKLKIDAFEGDILSARRIGWAPRHSPRDRSGFSIEFGLDTR